MALIEKRNPQGSSSYIKIQKVLRVTLILIAYIFLFVLLAVLTRRNQTSYHVVTWYPPAGVSFALLLGLGWKYAPALAITSLISSLFIHNVALPLESIFVWAVLVALIYGMVSVFLHRRLHFDPQLRNMRDVLYLIISALIVAGILSVIAIFGDTSKESLSFAEKVIESFTWGIRETVGILVITPFLLMYVMPWVKQFSDGNLDLLRRGIRFPPAPKNMGWHILTLLIALYLGFGVSALQPLNLEYLIAIPLIWMALEHGLKGVTLGILILNFGITLAFPSSHLSQVEIAERQLLRLVISTLSLLVGASRMERMQIAAELGKNERRFRALVENSLEEVSLVNAEGNLIYESPTTQRPLGYPPGSLIGYNMFELLHPDDRAAASQLLEQVVEEPGAHREGLFRLRHQNGSWRWMEGVITNLLDEPAVRALVINYRDVTERKLAEDSLRASEDRYRDLVEHSQDLICTHDLEGHILSVNPFAAKLLGYSSASLVGTNLRDFLAPESLKLFHVYLYQLRKRGFAEGTMNVLTKQGEKRVWEYWNTLRTEGVEEPIVRGMARDVTERVKAEQALRESEEHYRLLFESNPMPMWVYDLETLKFLAVNDAAITHYGYGRDEFLSMTIKEIRPPEELPVLQANLSAARGTMETSGPWKHRKKDGTLIDVEISSHSVEWMGRPARLVIANDVTERKKAELRIQHLTRLYATLSQVNNTIVRVRDQSELFQTICKVAVEYGKFGLAWIGLVDLETGQVTPRAVHGAAQSYLPFQDMNINQAPFKHGITSSAIKKWQIAYSRNIQTDPTMQHWREVATEGGFHSAAAVPFRLKGELSGLLNLYATDADFFTDEEQHNLLEEMGQDISFALDIIEIETRRKYAEEALRQSEERFASAFRSSPTAISITRVQDGTIIEVNDGWTELFGYTREQALGRTSIELGLTNAEGRQKIQDRLKSEGAIRNVDASVNTRIGESRDVLFSMERVEINGETCALTTLIDITERKKAEAEIRTRTSELATLYKLSRDLAEADDLQQIFELIIAPAVESVHTTFARIALWEGDKLRIRAAYPIRALEYDLFVGRDFPIAGLPQCQRAMSQDDPMILHENDPQLSGEERAALLLDFAHTICLIPLRSHDRQSKLNHGLGLLMLSEARSEQREAFTPAKLKLAQGIADQTAVAIHRTLLQEQTQRRLQYLTALREIDKAISSSFGLHLSMSTLLTQVIEQLHVDAAAIWRVQSDSATLEYSVGRGFQTNVFEQAKPLRFGEGYAGRAASEGRTIHIPNLMEQQDNPRLMRALQVEAFVSYYAVPLIARKDIKGVLEVFHRSPLEPDEEWLDFLHTLAGQAAIGIDNATLFDNMLRSNYRLTQAYNATIEGWSAALDLRDKETEGHTQRVTEMTLQLAKRMGFPKSELVHIRRGALLHDIGKMGVPDHILLKPDKLTEEEWVIMRKHPEFAYQLLSPIQYLQEALDIPYCHHEKWDGTGYPRGLRGEEIPLVARFFAVIDVWDALCSDRPYRPAWPKEKVIEHIRSLSGTHFDPNVVKHFLEMINR